MHDAQQRSGAARLSSATAAPSRDPHFFGRERPPRSVERQPLPGVVVGGHNMVIIDAHSTVKRAELGSPAFVYTARRCARRGCTGDEVRVRPRPPQCRAHRGRPISIAYAAIDEMAARGHRRGFCGRQPVRSRAGIDGSALPIIAHTLLRRGASYLAISGDVDDEPELVRSVCGLIGRAGAVMTEAIAAGHKILCSSPSESQRGYEANKRICPGCARRVATRSSWPRYQQRGRGCGAQEGGLIADESARRHHEWRGGGRQRCSLRGRAMDRRTLVER